MLCSIDYLWHLLLLACPFKGTTENQEGEEIIAMPKGSPGQWVLIPQSSATAQAVKQKGWRKKLPPPGQKGVCATYHFQ